MTQVFVDPVLHSSRIWKLSQRIYLCVSGLVLISMGYTWFTHPATKCSPRPDFFEIMGVMIVILALGYGILLLVKRKLIHDYWFQVDEQGILWHYLGKHVASPWEEVKEVRLGSGNFCFPNPNAVLIRTRAGRIRITLQMVDRSRPLPEVKLTFWGQRIVLERGDGTVQAVQPETSEVLAALKAHLPQDRFRQGWFLL